MTAPYPEHAKVKALRGRNEVVGAFLEWLEEHGLTICERTGNHIDNFWMPARKSIEQLIAEHFEIDRQSLEAEKRQMIADLQRETAGGRCQ